MESYKDDGYFLKQVLNIENLSCIDNNPLITTAPKPFRFGKWLVINVVILIVAILGSLIFTKLNSIFDLWYFEWSSNALLNVSFGLLVFLLIFSYTNSRERNIAYYTDTIPLLMIRYDDMFEEYVKHKKSLNNYYVQKDYNAMLELWKDQLKTGIIIIEFFQFLIRVKVLKKKLYRKDYNLLKKLSDLILDADRKRKNELIEKKGVHEDIFTLCETAMSGPFELLTVLKNNIKILENQLFEIKYGKRKLQKK